MHENASGRRADPAVDAGEVPARRYQVQWSRDLTASTPQEAAETAARQDLLRMFTMDLESGQREVVEVDRGDDGAAAVRMAADEMERAFTLTADDFRVSKDSVLGFLRRRADALDRERDGGRHIDPDVLEKVLFDQVGRHAAEEIFAALDSALSAAAVSDAR